MHAHSANDEVDVPRAQTGPNPQHLLTTVLGEYLDSAEADLPSAAVVAILREFGISESSARAALTRLTRRGLIAVRRPGRPPVYHLTPQAIARHHSRMQHFLTFGARAPHWAGEWTVVSFSLPESRQAQRHRLRKSLGTLGFVRLYDSVWIRPGGDRGAASHELHEILDGTDGARWSVMCARFDDEAGPHGPTAAYDLDGLAAGYRAFIDRYGPLLTSVRRGEVGAAQALVERTSLMDSWRVFADTDPDLPAHLLPAVWPRQAARELFVEMHSTLGPLAQRRLVAVTTPFWPAAGDWFTHFQAPTAPDPAAGGPPGKTGDSG
ncbi:MAG: PaaX family transcriptional regulator [Micromonosporaceae bacterium]|nr:PaaX family transcriptional regulator [Micromonosporaceae bacterium]